MYRVSVNLEFQSRSKNRKDALECSVPLRCHVISELIKMCNLINCSQRFLRTSMEIVRDNNNCIIIVIPLGI